MRKALFLFLLIKAYLGIAQSKDCVPPDTLTTNKLIVYHKPKNGYPARVQVRGEITKMTPGVCGYFCQGGTLEIQLRNPMANYPAKQVYLVTACLPAGIKCGQQVSLEATSLTGQENECYYQNILGGIDSKGIPFYKVSEVETAKIGLINTK